MRAGAIQFAFEFGGGGHHEKYNHSWRLKPEDNLRAHMSINFYQILYFQTRQIFQLFCLTWEKYSDGTSNSELAVLLNQQGLDIWFLGLVFRPALLELNLWKECLLWSSCHSSARTETAIDVCIAFSFLFGLGKMLGKGAFKEFGPIPLKENFSKSVAAILLIPSMSFNCV